uniref:C2 domain-containing protein n=1 Tax=Macrostomum lignano TaxID=282301 RepID=A0A1I8HUP3_9PLAT
KRFPYRDTHSLQAEAKFDGELLATDPIEHIENPEFGQELAWELDKKALAQHRLQRASIKLLLYAIDKQTTAKEQVGYVVLDVRHQQPRWRSHISFCTADSYDYDEEEFEEEPVAAAAKGLDHQLNGEAEDRQPDAKDGGDDGKRPTQPEQPHPPAGVSEADMYHAAMELELWKEAAKEAFEAGLKRREQTLVMAFAREFRRRDAEREAAHKKRSAEYEQLTEKLQAAIADVEEKERRLANGQRDLLQRRDDLQRRHDSRLKELQDASNRMQADCQQRIELERARCRQLEEQVAAAKSASHDWERRWKETEAALKRMRDAECDRPELEKSELERRLEQAQRAKQQYKQQLGRCLKELAASRQREQAAQSAALQRQQTELEHMRLRYLAAEEQDLVRKERGELKRAKEGLDTLAYGAPLGSEQPTGSKSGSEHAARLIEERDTLLRTGVYTHEDDIVRELERRIQAAVEA